MITPINSGNSYPASNDLHPGNCFPALSNPRLPHIDLQEPLHNLTEPALIDSAMPFMPHLGEFESGSTEELYKLTHEVAARPDDKSSLSGTARRRRMQIGQISLLRISEATGGLYGSPKLGGTYPGQSGPTNRRFHRDFGG